jgi:hypothetical protein
MVAERKIAHRWTRRNQDWVTYEDGHLGCLRFGAFEAGVTVGIRGATGRLAQITGKVSCLVPTYCGGVTVAVDWQAPKGIRLTPLWPAAYLEIKPKGVKTA